ncbi:SWIM-type domain-containing protein [Mycena venus]|uniref:SWIM-type domain-containing protein n=1 Tax=Mycena venus TaxID=2733690 RepID=A0A8H7D591_9AGAR|nr:SWIM-type domain-containing protein [Mycena venus]
MICNHCSVAQSFMADPAPRLYRPYPWPWIQPSILTTAVEEERRETNYWLDADLGKDDNPDDSDSEYVPSESSDGDASTSDSEDQMSASTADEDISDSELTHIHTDAQAGWRSSPTPSMKVLEEEEKLARQIESLVKAEEDAAAAYNPDEVVSLITQLYELLVAMGHWPEGGIRYPPHTNPAVDEELAVQLGYAPAAVSLMHRLPYLTPEANGSDQFEIVARTRFADYTLERHLHEGRRPYPYLYLDGCPDIDPWLLPLMLPRRDGSNIMLDTRLGVVRAYNTEGGPQQDSIEYRRHGKVPDAERDQATWTEYRRTALVPAARYFSEIIYAYRSLSRLPILNPDRNDPKEERHPSWPAWLANQDQEEQDTLLALYRECGWPHEWRRAEFMDKWEVKKKEISARAREAMQQDSGKRRQ